MPIVSVETFASAQFDYLIVGGGTSGLALASRLSEDANVTIGVIEAGGEPANVPELNVPGFMGRTIANPIYDWTFFSVPQEHANGRTVIQPRGKGLGGSSLINFMGMLRPSRAEYDALEGLGNEGWNWENLLYYMKKGENTFPSHFPSDVGQNLVANPNPKYHGTGGPLHKSYSLNLHPQTALFFDSAELLGVKRKSEMGDGTNIGSMSCFSAIDPRNATRASSFSAYFVPVQSRPNLLVLTVARVVKILFEPNVKPGVLHRAVGARFIHNGREWTVEGVKKDVILSAGAFQTPQLLELSGIGNNSLLKTHGVNPLIDLPGVGENLQEHPCVATIVEIEENFRTMDDLANPGVMQKEEELYKQQKGLLSSTAAVGFLFLSAKHLGIDIENDSISLIQSNLDTTHHQTLQDGLKKQYDLQSAWLRGDEVAQVEIIYSNGHRRPPSYIPVPEKRYASFISAILHPRSRGSVHLASPDPLVPPAIDPRYLEDPADLEYLAKAVGFSARVADTGPFGSIVKGAVSPDSATLDDAESLKEWIKEQVVSVFHPLGTAAMRPREDGGVVDADLKVYGTSNLRVADVSILPMQLSCHIQSAAYAIAEKAADIFKRGS